MGLPSFLSGIPFLSRLFGNQRQRILILGLNGGVGKTTVLYKLKDGSTVDCQHTVGFNLETVEINNTSYEVWDIGGGDKVTPTWKQYFEDTKAVIFVIDSRDNDRLELLEFELTRLLNAEELANVPFLLLANKQDKDDAMSLDDLKKVLKLENWKHRSIHLRATVATEGKGLTEGIEWLSSELAKAGN